MAVNYKGVQKTRAEAIRLGIFWRGYVGDDKHAKFNDYYEAWLKYQEMDLALAELEIDLL